MKTTALLFCLLFAGCSDSKRSSGPVPQDLTNTTFALTTDGVLPVATGGSTYSKSLAFEHGTAPVSWSIVAGSLPQGLALGPLSGVISGVPTGSAGKVNFTARAVDAVGAVATRGFTLSVLGKSVSWVTGATLPGGQVGQAYSVDLAAMVIDGVAPFEFSVNTGTLPAGLGLSTGGVLSGAPSSAGTSGLVLQVMSAPDVFGVRSIALLQGSLVVAP